LDYSGEFQPGTNGIIKTDEDVGANVCASGKMFNINRVIEIPASIYNFEYAGKGFSVGAIYCFSGNCNNYKTYPSEFISLYEKKPACTYDSDCGGYCTNEPAYCGSGINANNIYRNKVKFTCQNAGRLNAYCTNSTSSPSPFLVGSCTYKCDLNSGKCIGA
jgi:hypothetical protein